MEGLFAPDVFSNSRPAWKPSEGETIDVVRSILPFFEKQMDWSKACIEYSGAFEINSSNIRITFPGGDGFLLKRWPTKAVKNEIGAVLGIMDWLADRMLPVPGANRFTNGENILQIGDHFWNYFDFIEGDYFSGIENEFENVAAVTGDLAQALSEMPLDLYPPHGPVYLSDEDDAAFNSMWKQKDNWDEIFGSEHAQMLNEAWPSLIEDWRSMRSDVPDMGPLMPMHIDLHPHNLLFNNRMVSAVLDFESCKMMRIGCGIGFNAMKQCRQVMVVNKNVKPGDIGKKYIDILSQKFPAIDPYKQDLARLASMEVMRRLCIIFRASAQKTWNHVLPIQLKHLEEAKILFA
jgi:hypothetical protein